MAKKILIVDDDRDTRLLLQVILRKEGYEVCPAHDGYEALGLLDRETPDLIIVDAMMPGLDGFATLRELRLRPETATLPVVMLSAQTNDEGVLRAWRGGVDLYLEKPFDPRDLTAYIRRIFQERRSAADRRLDPSMSERRAGERRSLVEAAFDGADRRRGERRSLERRTCNRRLDFVADELV